MKTGPRKENMVRRWISLGSAAVLLILFVCLTDFGSKPTSPMATKQPEVTVSDAVVETEESDDSSEESVESSDVSIDSTSVILGTGNTYPDVEIERLADKLIDSSEIEIQLHEVMDTVRALALIDIAQDLYDEKFYKEALSWAYEAVQLDPDLPQARLILGYVYFRLRMTTEAIAAFDKTIELDSENFDAHLHLGMIYNGNKNPLLAIDYLNNAIKIAKSYEDISMAFTHRALSHALLEQYEECFADLDDALYLNPENGWAILVHGSVTKELEQMEMDVLEAEGIPGSKLGVSP